MKTFNSTLRDNPDFDEKFTKKTFEIFRNENNESIIVRGLGRFIFEQGLPLSIMIDELKMRGNLKISFLHLADELMRNGWSGHKTISYLKNETFIEDFKPLQEFCDASFEDQRTLLFKFLFGEDPKEIIRAKERGEKSNFDNFFDLYVSEQPANSAA